MREDLLYYPLLIRSRKSKELGQKIKKLAKENGLKNAEMAKLLNYSDGNYISKIYSGNAGINYHMLITLSDYFHVPISYFFEQSNVDNDISKKQIVFIKINLNYSWDRFPTEIHAISL